MSDDRKPGLGEAIRRLSQTGHLDQYDRDRLGREMPSYPPGLYDRTFPAPLPEDPFGHGNGHAAGIALGEMYDDMLAGGIPLASVERILGAMLASYGNTDKDGS